MSDGKGSKSCAVGRVRRNFPDFAAASNRRIGRVCLVFAIHNRKALQLDADVEFEMSQMAKMAAGTSMSDTSHFSGIWAVRRHWVRAMAVEGGTRAICVAGVDGRLGRWDSNESLRVVNVQDSVVSAIDDNLC